MITWVSSGVGLRFVNDPWVTEKQEATRGVQVFRM